MGVQVTESAFWQQVKSGLESQDTHLCRIESTIGSGIPDINACSNGIELFIELKVFHGNDLHFRSSQRAWILRRLSVGGRVLVLTRRDDCLLIYSSAEVLAAPFISHGADRKSFHIKGEDLPNPLYSCKKPFKWGEVRKILFNIS